MAKEKLSYEDFLATLGEETKGFVQKLHGVLIDGGCKIEVKSAASGYVASYQWGKKALLNYVFRKKGLLVRIYANHVGEYAGVLDGFPESLVAAVRKAPPCKRMLDPNACSPTCSMGYDFMLRGERCQKCRYSAFFFVVCEESAPHIRALLEQELQARKAS